MRSMIHCGKMNSFKYILVLDLFTQLSFLVVGNPLTLDSPTRLGLIDRKFTEVINRRAREASAVEGLQTT